MSIQIVADLQALGAKMDGILLSISALNAKLESAVARIDEVDGDRKAMRKEVRDFGGKLESLHALRDSIAKDAREILGATRDVIDPTKVKIPHVLKQLGYGKEATK